MGVDIIELKKIERQLVLYKYFGSDCIKEKDEALSLYGIPTSTIYKDIKDLTDAGLISIRYDATLKEYVRSDARDKYDISNEKPTRARHLLKLRRLGRCMRELYNDPTSYEYEFDDEDDENYSVVFIRGEKSCKDYYRELFPDVSARTMERDFITLTRIGYPIRYNRELQRYDFFDAMSLDSDYCTVPGVFYDKEKGQLCRKCGEYYDMELQENYLESIRGMRAGLPVDEWAPY